MKKILFLLLLIPRIAFGAVAHDASGPGATGGLVSTMSYSHTITGTNTLIICSVTYRPGGATYSVSGMTFNGVPLTQKAVQNTEPYSSVVEMWFLTNPATGTHTAQVDFTGNVDGGVFDCTSFTGAGTLGTATTTNDVLTGLACTVPANGLCYDVGFNNHGASGCAARTPGGSATKRYDICDDQGPGGSIEHFSSTISASATMTWDHDSGAYEGQIAVPINPAAPAPPASVARRKAMILQ
jgi:hypothetical protein